MMKKRKPVGWRIVRYARAFGLLLLVIVIFLIDRKASYKKFKDRGL